MEDVFSLNQVLEKSLWREVESQLLYINLRMIAGTAAARETFRELVDQELGHQTLLERHLLGELGDLPGAGKVIDLKIVEGLNQPEIRRDMPMKDIFLLAAQREKLAHEFYLGLAAVYRGEARRLLEGLAGQELAHKQRLELLYSETAFPQTDGG
ncbi:MAG: ferritin family protein [Chloroflexi bacterium]|nr:ferritin family protein [Chloroflexota bacterium]